MVKLVTIFFLTLLSFSTLSAQPYELIYSQRHVGAENYGYFDPLIDNDNQLAGFIYSDQAQAALAIDFFDADTLAVIGLGGVPIKTAHYYSSERDTLYIYALLNYEGRSPGIALITVTAEDVSTTVISANCYSGEGRLSGVIDQDIIFAHDKEGAVSGLWFEAVLRYEQADPEGGGTMETVPTSLLYSLDLRSEELRNNVTAVRRGNLVGNEDWEYAVYKNYHYQYRLDDVDIQPLKGQVKWTAYGVQDESSMNLAKQTTDEGYTYAVFLGNFDARSANDELIYHGESWDLADDHADRAAHVACYSLGDDGVKELWYQPVSGVRFEHVYKDRSVIVGVADSNRIVFLDYNAGGLIDTVEFDRELSNVAFFETYAYPSTLNLVGRSDDTVFVYRFDVSTRLTHSGSSDGESLPATFTLHQNRPNPFNGETRLSFDNQEAQYLSLKVYNILGQEVATLSEGTFSPGTYYAYWNGADNQGLPQSSGVYFAKLQGDIASQIIKLIYLK